MTLMACSYIGGALIYGMRFPERLRPGMFNYFVSNTTISGYPNLISKLLIFFLFFFLRVPLIKFSMSVL